jgi:aminopeptidase N
MSQKPSCLLPDDVAFLEYNLGLTPNLKEFTFEGTAQIVCHVHRSTQSITLHASELTIEKDGIKLIYPDALGSFGFMSPASVRFDSKQETVCIEFSGYIPKGKACLTIRYSGILNDKMAGFYRSKYTAPDGTEKYLAVTQFEATDARRAFPCGDEPSLKAKFNVALNVPTGMTALSNMPIALNLGREGGTRTVHFKRSPIMPTYLLAVVVGELDFVETTTKESTLIRVYTVPGKSEQGRFALETAKRVLEFYNEYFGIPYPLPKLDMVAIPDFAAGAMENWGLVTYRENALLIDPANSSAAAHQRVAEVVAHELAHMWFGNLVTMQWWTHLWLNEGFATWMASHALNALFPQWDIWTQFVSDEYASALALDSLRSTHPIEVPVEHPNEISQIFDDISYAKGASVIRMIHDAIGDEAFRKGLTAYLNGHAYGNATTEDLWAALAEASGQKVPELMDSWTKQPGYPVAEVVSSISGRAHIVQKRFLASGDILTPDEAAQRWHLPESFNRMCLGKCNAGQTTIARVSYSREHWANLARVVRDGEEAFPAVDRYGLASDALALTRAGYMSTSDMLNLLVQYRNETNYTVWTAVLEALGAVATLVEETADEHNLNVVAQHVLKPIATSVGWMQQKNEPHTTQLLRGAVLGAYGAYGDMDTTSHAIQLFWAHFEEKSLIHPNLRLAVYRLVARLNVWSDYRAFQSMYEKETLQEERVRLLNALGNISKQEIVTDLLAYTFESGEVRHGDVFYVLSTLGSHAVGRREAWWYITNHWDMLQQRYSGGGLKMLGRILSSVVGGFVRAEDADACEQFFASHPAPSATRAIAQSLERVRNRAAWYRRDEGNISTFLQGF